MQGCHKTCSKMHRTRYAVGRIVMSVAKVKKPEIHDTQDKALDLRENINQGTDGNITQLLLL